MAKSEHTQAATEIRKILKTNFPKIKFAVRAKSYTGGTSVYVDWENGPTVKSVDNLIGQYQYGKFDGMQDLYEHTNINPDIPQVKYLLTSRKIAEETRQAKLAELAEDFGIPMPDGSREIENIWHDKFNQWSDSVVTRMLIDVEM